MFLRLDSTLQRIRELARMQSIVLEIELFTNPPKTPKTLCFKKLQKIHHKSVELTEKQFGLIQSC